MNRCPTYNRHIYPLSHFRMGQREIFVHSQLLSPRSPTEIPSECPSVRRRRVCYHHGSRILTRQEAGNTSVHLCISNRTRSATSNPSKRARDVSDERTHTFRMISSISRRCRACICVGRTAVVIKRNTTNERATSSSCCPITSFANTGNNTAN